MKHDINGKHIGRGAAFYSKRRTFNLKETKVFMEISRTPTPSKW
jgi:hypothetical protein